jgi:addiction module HigA family antidote
MIMLNGRKRRPTHPGEILREDVIPALNITQGEFARTLGVSRRTVNEILQEKRPVTVDIAWLARWARPLMCGWGFSRTLISGTR